ncbi:hypothetical protein M0802_006441 [Mischocyttarus mexicanus]|nr:hypothetical protein M0802_006441 [Mischocyttarus mexicanus]
MGYLQRSMPSYRSRNSIPPSEKEVNVFESLPLGKKLGQEPMLTSQSAPSQCLSEYAFEGKSSLIRDFALRAKVP